MRAQLIKAGVLRPRSDGPPRDSAWILAQPCLALDGHGARHARTEVAEERRHGDDDRELPNAWPAGRRVGARP